MELRTRWGLALALAALTVGSGNAAAQSKLCVSAAYGVPGTDGKPLPWWTGSFDIDDPRWTGASGHSVGPNGAATPPIEVRTTWANEGGRDYLYLSWLVAVNVSGAPALTGKHWLYLAVLPPGATSIGDPGSRIVRVRFAPSATSADVPTYCESEASCPLATRPVIYQVLQPLGTNDTCGSIVGGAKFSIMAAGAGALPWLTDTLRFKNEPGRWAVQARIPVDPGATALGAGIPEDTALAYQSGLEISMPAVGDPAFAFHRWPRSASPPELMCDLVGSILDPDAVVVDSTATWPGLRTIGGGTVADPVPTPTDPAPCGHRLRIDTGDIGVRAGAAGSPLDSLIGTSAANTLVARVTNTSGAPIADHALTARFRIARWGAQVADDNVWENVPVRLPAANPTATTSNSGAIADGAASDLELIWDLDPDQRCQYTYSQYEAPQTPTERADWLARCEPCPVSAPTGARALGSTGPCLPKRFRHQCMAVELGGADVDFETRSTYRNMDFAPLSVFERRATIDTAGLPVAPGQTRHEIFLFVMPRNMPDAVQAQTYAELIAERAAAVLKSLAAPPRTDEGVAEDPRFGGLREGGLIRPLPGRIELPAPDEQELRRFPAPVRPLARELSRLVLLRDRPAPVKSADLVSALADSFDAAVLAQLVPTLDVYAYYRVAPKGRGLAPMTAFSLVTSHDGPVQGLRWALDDATRIGGNVYKLSIPVGGSREIGVRVQALEPGETPIVERPAGCCRPAQGTSTTAALGGTAPLGLATILVIGRRRRRKQARAQARA